MVYCIVPFCTSNSACEKISFHEFPSNLELRGKWLSVISRKGNAGQSHWVPTQYSSVCGKHFLPEDFKASVKKKLLKPGTIPSVFQSYPKYMSVKKTPKQSKRLKGSSAIHGKAADIHDINSPDCVPSLKIGYRKIEFVENENPTEKVVENNVEGIKKSGVWRKRLLLEGEIRNDTSKSIRSTNETRTLTESIPDTNNRILNLENTNVKLHKEQNFSFENEIFTYKNLLNDLQSIKKPNDFWSINPIPNAIICARWSKNYTCEKKLVINNFLNVMVFLKEKLEINLSDLMKITCVDDISDLLEKVENYKVIQFQDLD